MRADDRTEEEIGAAHVRYPITETGVDCVFQCARAGVDRDYFRPHELHPEDVKRLAFDVLFAHVDFAFHVEFCCDGGGCNAVLSCPGFGDDALFAHPACEQDLPDGTVDFVRAGMVQVFAFQIYFRAAEGVCQAFGVVEWVRSADIFAEVCLKFVLKIGVGFQGVVCRF